MAEPQGLLPRLPPDGLQRWCPAQETVFRLGLEEDVVEFLNLERDASLAEDVRLENDRLDCRGLLDGLEGEEHVEVLREGVQRAGGRHRSVRVKNDGDGRESENTSDGEPEDISEDTYWMVLQLVHDALCTGQGFLRRTNEDVDPQQSKANDGELYEFRKFFSRARALEKRWATMRTWELEGGKVGRQVQEAAERAADARAKAVEQVAKHCEPFLKK